MLPRNLPCLFPICGALALFCQSANAQILFDFATASQLSSNFVQTGAGAGNMSWQNVSGVGGVNGLVQATATSTDQTLVYNTGFDWTTGSSFTTSMFFQYRGVDAAATRQYAQIGLLESNAISFNGGGGQDYVSFRVQNSGGTQLQILGQSANNGTTTNVGLTSFNIAGNMTTNNWYRLSGTFTRLGGNTIGFSTNLIDFGLDGTVQGSTVASTSGNFTIAGGFYTDTEVFNGVRSTINSAQGYLDNYTVVPEPSSWALFALACVVTGIFVRRRGGNSIGL